MSRLIKKYSNRRMYDTKTSQPITLFELASLIRQGEEIQVMDHKTGKDLTPITLIQILLGQERGEKGLFSTLLRELIKKRENLENKIKEATMSDREKKEEKKGVEVDFGLGKISLGGIFEGVGNLIDLASKLSEEAEEIKGKGEIKGLGGKAKGIYGFSVRTLAGKKPVVETFGNIKRKKEGPVIEEVREPIVDVLEEKDFVRVISELPGVSKEDVKVKINEDILNLSAERGERKYAKEILLPFPVKEDPEEFSFNNGILELKLVKGNS
ncbi:hypothetical protein HQ584_04280 [Patescibacteria group bacterium]|nr:hypothetical protein [Patescibacteria group bacterium]